METFAGINFPPAESAAGPGAEHPDSIPNPEESGGRTQILTLGNSPGLIQQRPTATRHAEKVEEKREGGWLCRAAVISSFFFFFLLHLSPLHNFQKICFMEALVQVWANRCGALRRTANKQSRKVLSGRVLRCSQRREAQLGRETWRSCWTSALATSLKRFFFFLNQKWNFSHRLSCFFNSYFFPGVVTRGQKFTKFGSLYMQKVSLKKRKVIYLIFNV